jgi:hypothetical protein
MDCITILIAKESSGDGRPSAQIYAGWRKTVMPPAEDIGLEAALQAVASDPLLREEWRSVSLRVKDVLLSDVIDPEGASVGVCSDATHGFCFSVDRALCLRTGVARTVEEIPDALMTLVAHVTSEEAYNEEVKLNAFAPSIEGVDLDDPKAIRQGTSNFDEFYHAIAAIATEPGPVTMVDLLSIVKLDPSTALTYADMSGLDFGEMDLDGCNFEGADLSYCDFSRAKVDGMSYEYADITGTKWPPGFIVRRQDCGRWLSA